MPKTILFEAFIDKTQTMTCTTNDVGMTDQEWEKLSNDEKEEILTDYMKAERMPHSWSAKLI